MTTLRSIVTLGFAGPSGFAALSTPRADVDTSSSSCIAGHGFPTFTGLMSVTGNHALMLEKPTRKPSRGPGKELAADAEPTPPDEPRAPEVGSACRSRVDQPAVGNGQASGPALPLNRSWNVPLPRSPDGRAGQPHRARSRARGGLHPTQVIPGGCPPASRGTTRRPLGCVDGGRENHPPGSVRPLLADSRRVRVADRQRYRLAGPVFRAGPRTAAATLRNWSTDQTRTGRTGYAFVTLGMGKRLMIELA